MEVSSLSFYHFDNKRSQWWAFKQMRLAYAELAKTEGLIFHKQLGSGAGAGFSIWPNWGVYAQLMVWKSQDFFAEYLAKDPYHQAFLRESKKHIHIMLQAHQLKGTWNSKQPFAKNIAKLEADDLMAVITRASIRPRKMLSFWRNVPEVAEHIQSQESLVFAKGVGEWPLVEQATFSIWQQKAQMQNFAYQKEEHKEVVKKTRELDWYAEEMFVRFKVIDFFGTWRDGDFRKLWSTRSRLKK